MMTYKRLIGKDLKGSDRGVFKVQSGNFCGKAEENHETLGIAGIPVEIRNEHIPNASPVLYL
jgi:hypothetical protein